MNFLSKRIISLAAMVVALLLLQACSAVKLAYDNAPEFIFWWMDGYVDFQGEQGPAVREELARLHQWHRANELPKLADLLRRVQTLAVLEVTPTQVCGVFHDSRERYNAVLRRAEGPALALASNLRAEQLQRMEAKFRKINAEWQREWLKLNPAERLQRRIQTNTERAEEFYGKLEEKQITALRENLSASSFDPERSYAERQRRQQDLLATLRQLAGRGDGVAARAEGLGVLRAYEDRLQNSPTLGYKAYSDNSTLEACKTMAALHNSTTPEQRRRAVARLAAYERDALELAGRK
jgi:hypothetical protein